MRKLMDRRKIFPIALELVGVAIIGVGIGVEMVTHADIGHLVITAGSLLVAIGGVIWGKFIYGVKK